MDKKIIVIVAISLLICNFVNIQADTTNSYTTTSISNISSGFARIRTEIINEETMAQNDVPWSISISGGLFGFINTTTEGEIDIPADSKTTIRSDIFFGIGTVIIEVTVGNEIKRVTGFCLNFFTIIFPESNVDLELVADGLTSPVGATHAGDGSDRLFITDQTGIIYVIDQEILQNEPYLNITDKLVDLDVTYDERGLLGLAFHPNYESNGRFFVYYSAPKQESEINHESIIAEYTVSTNPNIAEQESERIILRIDQPEANHNGGQLAFGPDGYLYIGLGDGGGAGDQHGQTGNGQNITSLLGSIIRIDVDGSQPYDIPSDNPFLGGEGADEIYAYGFRNPWKFSFDQVTGKLWVGDVGQDEWEEIDAVEKGGNYGWRILEATHPYDLDLADLLGINLEDLEDPIHEYNHDLGRSITGGFVYRGSENEELVGKYVFGDWSTSFLIPDGKIYYLDEVEPDVYQRFELRPSGSFNRFVLGFGQDESSELYVCVSTSLGPSGSSGEVYKIKL